MRKGDCLSLDDYEITEDGQVINKRFNRALKPQPNNKGYGRVMIGKKFYFVHKLVAEKYVPNPFNKPQVNHIDGDKTNNHYTNLEWVTNSENREHAVKHGLHLTGAKCPYSKLTKEDVKYIRSHSDMNHTKLGEMFGVARTTINDVIARRTWIDS